MHIYIYIYVHRYRYIYRYTCRYIQIHIRIYIYIYIYKIFILGSGLRGFDRRQRFRKRRPRGQRIPGRAPSGLAIRTPPCSRENVMHRNGERIIIQFMTSDRRLRASREGSKCRRTVATKRNQQSHNEILVLRAVRSCDPNPTLQTCVCDGSLQ